MSKITFRKGKSLYSMIQSPFVMIMTENESVSKVCSSKNNIEFLSNIENTWTENVVKVSHDLALHLGQKRIYLFMWKTPYTLIYVISYNPHGTIVLLLDKGIIKDKKERKRWQDEGA